MKRLINQMQTQQSNRREKKPQNETQVEFHTHTQIRHNNKKHNELERYSPINLVNLEIFSLGAQNGGLWLAIRVS